MDLKIVDGDDSRSENSKAWSKLEETIHNAFNTAFLLAQAIEADDKFYGNDKREAVAFGVYSVEERIKEMREAWRAVVDEVRTIRSEGQDSAYCDDDGNKKKVVNLH